MARAANGLPAVDPSTNLPAFLKLHRKSQTSPTRAALGTSASLARFGATRTGVNPNAAGDDGGSAEPSRRWDEMTEGTKLALRNAWRINLVDLNFRTVTVITAVAILGICLFVAAVLPPANRRTAETDTLEFALVTLLTTMFSPLSFNYAYVWLLYPTTLALHRVLSEPRGARRHRLKAAWIAGVLLIPAFAIPFPQVAQAYGNLFVPALLLVLGLGMILRTAGRRVPELADVSSTHLVSGELAALRGVAVARSL